MARTVDLPTQDAYGANSLAPGTVVAGRYRIVGTLGQGGMGTVYRAVQEPLGREVALKVILPALAADADAGERFRREAKAVSALAHPNIVTVFDFGVGDGANGDGVLFIAMELLVGEGLDAVVRRGPMAPARAIPVLRGICAALAEAHARGIIHRDLKPQNVMLTSTSTQQDVVKVVDFGIARLADGAGGRTLTQTGAVVGTPGYVAPELFDGAGASPSSDLYALGVLAYELLCGTPPFPGVTPREILKAVLFGEPLPLRNFARDLPPVLEALVLSLLDRDPTRRPASAKAVDDALASMAQASSLPPLPPLPAASSTSPASTGIMMIESLPPPLAPGLPPTPPPWATRAPPPAATPSTGVLLTEAMAPPRIVGPQRPPAAPQGLEPRPKKSVPTWAALAGLLGVSTLVSVCGVVALAMDADDQPDGQIHDLWAGTPAEPTGFEVPPVFNDLTLETVLTAEFREFGVPESQPGSDVTDSARDTLLANAALSRQAHHFEGAVAQLLTILRYRPKDAEAHRQLGNAFLRLNREDVSRFHRMVFLNLAPDHPDAEAVRQAMKYKVTE